MAKKTTTKTTKPVVENINNDTIVNEAMKMAEEEIKEISEKVEALQVTDEMLTDVVNSNPSEAVEIINEHLSKINEVQVEIEKKIEEIIETTPELVTLVKNQLNRQFTNTWNGCSLD